MPRVLVPLATGFEEIEAVAIIDVLRRADIEVTVAGLTPGPVTGSHGISIGTDADLDMVIDETYEMIVLPGGLPGANTLRDHLPLRKRLQDQVADGKNVAAICAAPQVLEAAGILSQRRATSYPGFIQHHNPVDADSAVVVDGPIITSRGPGTALIFALRLVEQLTDPETSQQLAERMLVAQ